MHVRWSSHLKDPKERESFVSTVRNSTTALSRLQQIIIEDLEALDRAENSEAQYDIANWAALQAHRNGQRSKLQDYLNLLSFLDQEK